MEERYRMVQEYTKDIENQICYLQNALALTQSKLAFYENLLQEPSYKSLTYMEEWTLFKEGGQKKE